MNLNYDDNNDSYLYIEDYIKIESISVELSAITVSSNEKSLNEDSFALKVAEGRLWVAVFDGTTSLKKIPELKESGARYASHFLKDQFYKIELDSPKNVLKKLNKLLLESSMSIGGSLDDTHSLPASMGTILEVNLKNNSARLAHIGDTYVLEHSIDGTSKILSDDKNSKFDTKMFKLMKSIANDKNITIKEARNDELVVSELYQMFIERNNNPNGKGSGIINGDPNMNIYIYENNFSIKNTKELLVASDGLEIVGKNLYSCDYRNELFTIINDEGLEGLVKEKKKSENKDPDWKHVRYKHSDDATGVYINLSANHL